MKYIILIIVKVQEKVEWSLPQNIEFDQSKKTPLYTKLHTKITTPQLSQTLESQTTSQLSCITLRGTLLKPTVLGAHREE